MLGLILSGALCYANSAARTRSMEGEPLIIRTAQHGGTDKSGSISASIDGHYLTVIFTENLGQVSIEVTTSMGVPVETLSMTTPNGRVFYIAATGGYIVNFTLSNGDEYYGEFTVTD